MSEATPTRPSRRHAFGRRSPILVYNTNGTLNKNKSIKEFVILQLAINNHYKYINLTVTELRDIDLFLEHNWLKVYNSSIDWVNAILFFDYYSETYRY